jgi:hypothetical protein
MDATFIDLLTTKGVVGVLAGFILFLIMLLKIVFDMWKASEQAKTEISKDLIGIVFKYEFKVDLDRKDNADINNKLNEIQKAIHERNR